MNNEKIFNKATSGTKDGSFSASSEYERLEELRKKNNFTVEAITEKVSISPNRYSAYKGSPNGFPLDILTKLASIYDVSLDYIILGRESASENPILQALNNLPSDDKRKLQSYAKKISMNTSDVCSGKTMQERLKNLRTNAKLTQQQVADKIFKTQQAYAKYEGNISYPSIDTLIALSKLHNVSLDYIIRGKRLLSDEPFFQHLGKLSSDELKDLIASLQII